MGRRNRKSKKKGGKKTSNKKPSGSQDKGPPSAEELKAGRDKLAAMLADPKHASDLDENKLSFAHFLMAMQTKMMAEMGLIDDEKHSCLEYCEEHADEIFDDGGTKFFQDLEYATEKVKSGKKTQEKMVKLIEDGDIPAQMLLREDYVRSLKMKRDAQLASQGLSEDPEDDPFLGTVADDELFKPCPPQPDCPICFLPLQHIMESNVQPRVQQTYQPCCGKTLCDGCLHAHRDSSTEPGYTCPFCRGKCGDATDKDRIEMLKTRIECDDESAMFMLGGHYLQGSTGLRKDLDKAFKLLSRAAELGDMNAHHTLGMAYHDEDMLGLKSDEKKSMHHLRLAAIGGVVESRHLLGNIAQEKPEQDFTLAIKHYIIAAEAGHDICLKKIKYAYSRGIVTKDTFAKALRAHKAASDEMRSDQRDAIAKLNKVQAHV